MSQDFLFHGSVGDIDPDLQELLDREDQRQEATIILIASESESPDAVREAMGSRFGNIYAEGYPREESRQQTQSEILDFDMELAPIVATAILATTRASNMRICSKL